MKKLVLCSALTAILAFSVLPQAGALEASAPSASVQAGRMLPPPPKDGRPMPPPRMRRPQLSNAEAAQKLQNAYGYRYSDMLRLLNNGHSYSDMNTACLYAYLADVPVDRVLQLRQPATWGRVRVQLGLTPKLYAERYMQYQASYLPADSLLDGQTALTYLRQGYPLEDIKKAATLAQKSGRTLAEVLPLRTVACDWQQVEQKLGLAQEQKQPVPEFHGRGQRSGAGFAGLHVRNMTAQRAAQIFHADYLFPEEELLPLYEKYGYEGLEDICLTAYMSKKSLQEIIDLRDKYSWERMRYVLGLTPQVYFDRCVAYQARRLEERMDIPQKVTKKYMRLGYAMHHINSSYLLAQMAGRDIGEVIEMKTPKNSWKDVALRLGLTEADSRQVKDKISRDFGRHE